MFPEGFVDDFHSSTLNIQGIAALQYWLHKNGLLESGSNVSERSVLLTVNPDIQNLKYSHSRSDRLQGHIA